MANDLRLIESSMRQKPRSKLFLRNSEIAQVVFYNELRDWVYVGLEDDRPLTAFFSPLIMSRIAGFHFFATNAFEEFHKFGYCYI